MKLTPIDAKDYEAILPLAAAKRHNRVDGDANDEYLEEVRDWAVDEIEFYAKRPMSNRSFRLELSYFPTVVRFPISPVTEIESIDYYTAADVDDYLDASDWQFGEEALIAANVWPVTNLAPGNVRITFMAGEVSKVLVAAAQLAIAAKFDNRISPDLTAAHKTADRVRIPTL